MSCKLRAASAAAIAVLVLPSSHALTLAEAFDAARANDSQYRAALHERNGVRLGVPIARASLLPQVGFSMSTSEVGGTRSFPNSLSQDVSVRVDYNAPASSLSVRAPVLNFEGLFRLRQAQAQTASAEQTYRARGLALVDRLSTAYVQALLVRAAMALTEREVAATQAQYARAQQRQLRGEGTRTEVAQTLAALEQARFRQLDVRDQLGVSMSKLRNITGQELAWMHELPADFRPSPLQPATLAEWQAIAADESPSIQARRENVEVTRAGVKRSFAGHLPRVDLVASVSRNKNESLNNLNQSSALTSIGVQLQVPIFSGFGIDAAVQQARTQQAQTEEELRTERETVSLEIERFYFAVLHGASRIEAAARVVEANETALTGISRSLEAGLSTGVDVLDARARLFSALRDAAQARYDYLAARMRLMAQAGLPMQSVVDDLDRILAVKTEMNIGKP